MTRSRSPRSKRLAFSAWEIFRHPPASPRIPGHGDGILHIRLRGKHADLEPRRHLHRRRRLRSGHERRRGVGLRVIRLRKVRSQCAGGRKKDETCETFHFEGAGFICFTISSRVPALGLRGETEAQRLTHWLNEGGRRCGMAPCKASDDVGLYYLEFFGIWVPMRSTMSLRSITPTLLAQASCMETSASRFSDMLAARSCVSCGSVSRS